MFRLEDELRSLVERGAESFDLTHGESTHLDCSNEDDFGEEDSNVAVRIIFPSERGLYLVLPSPSSFSLHDFNPTPIPHQPTVSPSQSLIPLTDNLNIFSPEAQSSHPIPLDESQPAPDVSPEALPSHSPMLADDNNIVACLDRAEDLLQQSMFRLEDEFRSLVERGAESFDLTRGESTHLDCSNEDDFGEEDSNVAVRIIFPSDRRLCDHVFLGLSSH
ncbi:unnamed protein product [Fraxinus pennsylvanica]|uniref:Uncharacterized protein n=1 Tax=Fraxinus pennsylvanica TaxID=56036 RepID=A0AAD1Z5H9_9LAMI|nr:unnamed protein product [Fraxinus pennsylvanica]